MPIDPIMLTPLSRLLPRATALSMLMPERRSGMTPQLIQAISVLIGALAAVIVAYVNATSRHQ